MSDERTGVAIIGCGNIAGRYAQDVASYPELQFVGCYDLEAPRAEKMATERGGKAYPTLDALLADPAVKIAVNLTIHHAHYEITKRCLEAGKHVFSEKPLALSIAEARDLVAIAKRKKLRLGSSPFTWMGEAQQTAWKMIRDGQLGQVRLCYAEVNHGRIESWHPNPGPFYAVGPWFDVGVYPLTLLTTFFGPVKSVTALGKVLYPDRVTKEGKEFHIDTPDCVLALLELTDGQLARLSVNFYVRDTRQAGIEFHGDKGSLHLGSWQGFNAGVAFAKFGEGLKDVPPIKAGAPAGTEWGRGIREMAEAIKAGRPHRATGAQAAHVVEVLCAATKAFQTGRRVAVRSTFPRPEPMDWGR